MERQKKLGTNRPYHLKAKGRDCSTKGRKGEEPGTGVIEIAVRI